MPGGHDQLFKDLIRTFSADLVTLMAPAIARFLDLESLEFRPEEHFLDIPKGRQRRLDLVAKAPLQGGGFVVLHVETELYFRKITAPRLWKYNKLLSLRHGLPVFTFVIFLRGGPPDITAQIEQAMALDQDLGSFHYLSFGLSRAPADAYLAKPEPLAWALAALMRPRPEHQPLDLRLACLRHIAKDKNLDEVQRFLLFNCVATYLELDGRAVEVYQALLAEHGNQEVETMELTWADKMIAQGREQGLEQGIQKGIQEGLQTLRELVIHQLRQRFDRVPRGLVRRISKIGSAEGLSRLGQKVLEIESLDELELD